MAELRQLWPKLKKKLSSGKGEEAGNKKWIHGNASKKKSSKQPNPYSTHGLDKLAVVVAELQAKKTSLVDHTGNSVAAARSLSRSAQEWTATTLVRTASRGRRSSSSSSSNTQKETSPPQSSTTQSPSPSFSRPSELLFLQCSPQSSVGNTEVVDFSQSFSFAASSDEPAIVGELSAAAAADDDVGLGRDRMADDEVAAMAERRSDPSQEVGCSGSPEVVGIASLPSKGSICINKKGRGLKGKGWRALAVLMALGAYIASHTANFVNPLAAAMSFSVVIRRWHKGKMYAKFVFFRYFLTPLQAYITAHSPRTVLAILPARKAEVDVEKEEAADVDSQFSSRGSKLHPKADSTTDEVVATTTTHVRNPSFGFPVLPLGSMPPSPMGMAAPSSLLAPSVSAPATLVSLLATSDDEITPARVEVEVSTSAGFRRFPLSSASSMEREGASPTRRLARKILLKLKPRKSSKASLPDDVARREDEGLSSTADSPVMSGATTPFSGSEPGSPMFSPSSSRVSSPERHHRKFPFSRKPKGKSSLANDDDASADGGEQNLASEQKHPKALERRSNGNKRCILRRDRGAPDHGHASGGSNASRKLPLCRTAPADSVDAPTTSQAAAGLELGSSSQPGAGEEAKEKNVEMWPMVGLFVTLLFLMVGKFPAIVATSCFFIVLSTREKPHHRPLGRGTGRALEAARKLNRSPPPRAAIRVTPPGSPARGEYRKRAN